MRNISFDNPLLLLVIIPLLALTLIPFFISRSKDNRSRAWTASLVIHVVISLLVTLAIAGLMSITVLTKTTVYVVADVSYSESRDLDEIDAYIKKIENDLPQNSELGIICFAEESELLVPAGAPVRSVRDSTLDGSVTNIASALDLALSLFEDGTVKRVVLITDGRDTTSSGTSGLVASVERLAREKVKLDTVFIDPALTSGESEVQISDAEYTRSTYQGHENVAKLLVRSTVNTNVLLDLYRRADGEEEYTKIDSTVIYADVGLNVISMPLPTDETGVFDYKAEIKAESDVCQENNLLTFTSTVEGRVKILLVTGNRADADTITALCADKAEVDAYIVNGRSSGVPYTVEALAAYDEIILSNVDIREMANANAFMDSADIVVSQYGKSLMTVGDLKIQNKDDVLMKSFEELLPISYGNSAQEAKLYTFVLDTSRSMHQASKLIVEKLAAEKLISLLTDDDYVALVTFSGDVEVRMTPTRLGDCRDELITTVRNLIPTQGTFLGQGLKSAYDIMVNLDFEEKQIMLISDGKTFTHEPENAVTVAEQLADENIAVSTINALNTNDSAANALLSNIAQKGGGNYYALDREERVDELIFATVADDLTESIVRVESPVNIAIKDDNVLSGIPSIENVNCYVQTAAKYNAVVPLTVNYTKPSGKVTELPLYAYRSHGNGTVATFASGFSGDWLRQWSEKTRAYFFSNVRTELTPEEKIDTPYALTVEQNGAVTYVEIVPSSLNMRASARAILTYPDGKTEQAELIFDSQKYYYTFTTASVGAYKLETVYSYGENEFSAVSYFDISYLSEYDAFAVYDKAAIYEFVRANGKIYEGEIPNLESDESEISTYKLSFRIPLLIIIVALFIIDVIVRKLKRSDIENLIKLFRGKRKRGDNAK